MNQAPPRLSANGEHGLPVDPDVATRVMVTVDGDLLRDLIAYDAIEGWVEVVAHDDKGRRRTEGAFWVCHRIFGKVKAVLR